MFDVSQNISLQLRKNLKTQSSLSPYFHFRNKLKTKTYSLLTHSHPCIILCHPLCSERVHKAGYKLGH